MPAALTASKCTPPPPPPPPPPHRSQAPPGRKYASSGILGLPAQSTHVARGSSPPPTSPHGLPTVGGFSTPRRPTGQPRGSPDGSPDSELGMMLKDGQTLKFPKGLNINMNPARLKQELEEWLHKIGMILGTWCDEVPLWWDAQSDKYGLEKVYTFGGPLPIPVKSKCVETVLRVELADPRLTSFQDSSLREL
eukprot:4675772-Amphidinium_carterae.5